MSFLDFFRKKDKEKENVATDPSAGFIPLTAGTDTSDATPSTGGGDAGTATTTDSGAGFFGGGDGGGASGGGDGGGGGS